MAHSIADLNNLNNIFLALQSYNLSSKFIYFYPFIISVSGENLRPTFLSQVHALTEAPVHGKIASST